MNDKQDYLTALGKRIRELREICGFSQEQVAQYLGISRPAATTIENGTRNVTAQELAKLAKLFGCSTDSLVEADKPQPSKNSEKTALIARAAGNLDEKDLDEVLKFAEFLRVRSKRTKK